MANPAELRSALHRAKSFDSQGILKIDAWVCMQVVHFMILEHMGF